MRIVDLETFLGMPAGTVFSKYEPVIFGPLSIKGESRPQDFFVQGIADAIECADSDEYSDRCFAAEECGASIRLDFECECRDGMFEDGQLFAVWENEDVRALILRLQRCVKG